MRIRGRHRRLTRDQSEQLVARATDPEDLPADLAKVAAVLAAAAAPAPAREPEPEMIAALAAVARDAVTSSPSRVHAGPRRRARLVAALVGAALAVSGSLAAFGALPDAAQSVAHTVLAKIGISVPGPNAHAGDHPNTRGKSDEHKPATTPEPTPQGKPSVVPPLPSQVPSQATSHVPSVLPTPSAADHSNGHRP